MRKVKYGSNSKLQLWEKNPEEFYLRHMATARAPHQPQTEPMSVGSAFDGYVKSELILDLFGKIDDPAFELDAILETQVEAHVRDWARPRGKHCFDAYVASGAYARLRSLLDASDEKPTFEFTVEGDIPTAMGPVPFVRKPDCRFVYRGVHVILDWKVKGYCGKKSGTSPSKCFLLCCDGYDAAALGIKPSRSHDKPHKDFRPLNYGGLEIHEGSMHEINRDHADQLSIYGWLMGEAVGDENVVVAIEELVAKPRGDRPLLRVATHRARVARTYQQALNRRIGYFWHCVDAGRPFTGLSAEENAAKCAELDAMASSLQSDGSAEEEFFAHCGRADFGK